MFSWVLEPNCTGFANHTLQAGLSPPSTRCPSFDSAEMDKWVEKSMFLGHQGLRLVKLTRGLWWNGNQTTVIRTEIVKFCRAPVREEYSLQTWPMSVIEEIGDRTPSSYSSNGRNPNNQWRTYWHGPGTVHAPSTVQRRKWTEQLNQSTTLIRSSKINDQRGRSRKNDRFSFEVWPYPRA